MVEERTRGDGGLIRKNLVLRNMHVEVMAILVIHIFMAGLQPVTWEGVVQEENFSTSPSPSPTGRGKLNWM